MVSRFLVARISVALSSSSNSNKIKAIQDFHLANLKVLR